MRFHSFEITSKVFFIFLDIFFKWFGWGKREYSQYFYVLKWFVDDYLWEEHSKFLFLNVFSSGLAPQHK